MERIGKSLFDLWKDLRPFSSITVMQIGLQMVRKRAQFNLGHKFSVHVCSNSFQN